MMPVVDFDLCPGIYTKQMCVCACAQGSPNLEDKHFGSCSYNYTRVRRPRASFLKVGVLFLFFFFF